MCDVSPTSAWQVWEAVRREKPLIQCITNFVSMDIMANALLAAGASPAMVHAIEEVEEFVPKTSAVVVNVGTLSKEWVQSMMLAAQQAKNHNKPWVLDPVGAGATEYRTKTILSLLALQPSLVRGNASEIMALAGASFTGRGVDSTAETSEALQMGRQLALSYRTVVAITGAVDLVTNGVDVIEVHNGVPLMGKITAGGCSVTALAAAFISASPAAVPEATAYALGIFGLAAEKAARTAAGPGSLRTGLLDALHNLTEKELSGLKLKVLASGT